MKDTNAERLNKRVSKLQRSAEASAKHIEGLLYKNHTLRYELRRLEDLLAWIYRTDATDYRDVIAKQVPQAIAREALDSEHGEAVLPKVSGPAVSAPPPSVEALGQGKADSGGTAVAVPGSEKPSDPSYCPKCGEYMPMTLDESKRVHDCDRTAPSDGLPTGICACPICGGYGRYRWGCWGSKERPHPHAYMRPIHELLQDPAQPEPPKGSDVSDSVEALEAERDDLLAGRDQANKERDEIAAAGNDLLSAVEAYAKEWDDAMKRFELPNGWPLSGVVRLSGALHRARSALAGVPGGGHGSGQAEQEDIGGTADAVPSSTERED